MKANCIMSASTSIATSVISIERPVLSPQQEQEKWLGEAVQAVNEKSLLMKAYIRQRDFIQVLRSAAQMLSELSTNLLAPQNYYELYVKIFDELQHLEQFFEEEHQRGRSLEEIYEVVQHAGNIVPRLYLLITAGSVYIKSGEQPVIEILCDLVEMCKGVQHPTRGLFLRHFLLTTMKSKLPGDSNRTVVDNVETDGGTVEDAAELILRNFKEMNWLWIRMDAKGPGRAMEQSQVKRKQKDRKELRVLVGMNIVRLSQLGGVERKTYKSAILPRLLNIIAKYREPLAQQYLLEVIVQVFPDEFHLFTLDELLSALENVSSSVDVCAVLHALIERLGNYALSLRDGITEAGSHKEEKALHKVFHVLRERIEDMVNTPLRKNYPSNSDNNNNRNQSHNSISMNNTSDNGGGSRNGSHPSNDHHRHNIFSQASYVDAMFSLVRFAIRADEAVTERIGAVLTGMVTRFQETPLHEPATRYVEKMLIYIIETIKNPSEVLQLDGLCELTLRLPFLARRAVAVALCTVSVRSPSYRVTSLELAGRLFELMAPLVKDASDAPAQRSEVYGTNPIEDFAEEQQLVCRVLHLLQCDDLRIQMKLLNGVRRQLGQGGSERIVITLPALASLYLQLALRIKKAALAQDQQEEPEINEGKAMDAAEASSACAKALRTVYSGDGKGILEILSGEVPLQTFYLYLASANAADTCELSDVAYDLFAAALQIFGENAAGSRQQMEMLNCIVSSLHTLRSMPEDKYEVLATNVCQYSSKLLRKSDQSRMVALCAHLFWKNVLSDESHGRVMECLQRSLRIADHAPDVEKLPLFVDLLNQMLHYYAGKAPGVTAKYVSALIDLVQEASSNNNNNGGADAVVGGGHEETYATARTFYRNTTRYIRSRQQVDERWKEIEV